VIRFLRTQYLLGLRAGLPRRDARIRAVRTLFEGF
jgi:hypothetical protein